VIYNIILTWFSVLLMNFLKVSYLELSKFQLRYQWRNANVLHRQFEGVFLCVLFFNLVSVC